MRPKVPLHRAAERSRSQLVGHPGVAAGRPWWQSRSGTVRTGRRASRPTTPRVPSREREAVGVGVEQRERSEQRGSADLRETAGEVAGEQVAGSSPALAIRYTQTLTAPRPGRTGNRCRTRSRQPRTQQQRSEDRQPSTRLEARHASVTAPPVSPVSARKMPASPSTRRALCPKAEPAAQVQDRMAGAERRGDAHDHEQEEPTAERPPPGARSAGRWR